MRRGLPLALLLLTACPESSPPPPSGDPATGAADAVGRTVDDAGAGPAGQRPEDARWELAEGEGVLISGTVTYTGSKQGSVRMDFLTQEGNQPPNLVHAAAARALGEFSVQAPKEFGKVHIVAFIDAAGDGPSADDPAATVSLEIGAEPIANIALELSDTPELGALTPGADPPPPEPPPEGAMGGSGEPGAAEGAAAPPADPAAGSAGSGGAATGAATGG